MEQQYFSKIDAHGRFTIPAPLRRALRLRPGTRVVFTAMPSYIVLETYPAWLRRMRTSSRAKRGLAARLPIP